MTTEVNPDEALSVPNAPDTSTLPIRNAFYGNAENTIINMEFEHPVYSWLPTTVMVGQEADSTFLAQAQRSLAGTTISPFIDSRSVEQLLTEAKEQRLAGRYAPISVAGKTFDADELAQANINAVLDEWDILATDGTVAWTLEDNSVVSLTQTELRAVKQSIILRNAQLHEDYRVYKESLAA